MWDTLIYNPLFRCLSFFVFSTLFFCCLCLCNVISIAYTGFCTDKIIKSDFFCLQKGSGWPSGVVSPRDTMFIVHSEQSHQFPSLALATSSPSSTFKPISFTCHQHFYVTVFLFRTSARLCLDD